MVMSSMTQAHHGKAHDGAGGERHAQAAGSGSREAALAVRAVGVGGDLHADEAGQHGEHTAGEEGEGGKLGQHLAARGRMP